MSLRPNSSFKILKETIWDYLVTHPLYGEFHWIKPPKKLPKMTKIPRNVQLPPYLATKGRPDLEPFAIKTFREIQGVRDACRYASQVLNKSKDWIKPGVTTNQLDEQIHDYILSIPAYPSPLGYMNFPKSVCTSINNVVVHGVPDDRPLQDGDIVNVDVTVYYKGFHGDCSATYHVGESMNSSRKHLVETTHSILLETISKIGPGQPLCTIGNTLEPLAKSKGFSIVHGFVGHGIGKNFHELPLVEHTENEDDHVLQPGTIFTIEPVLSQGEPNIYEAPDGWTVLTGDGAPCAQWEHTILITPHGCEILTKP